MIVSSLVKSFVSLALQLRLPHQRKPARLTPTNLAKHQVKSGETFYSIARIHNVSMKSLQAANPEVVPTKMYVGQTLRIDGSARPQLRMLPKTLKSLKKQLLAPPPKERS